ncbi:hypothetical protein EUGRSUZ_J00129 [Eucalyptus grandis]|uniref:Uncharacterized protein n=2 Tax=Eucalyptus grandis TaxID=71139 RepID=A0ACC3J2S8_EUCGR|nr:hypothetical protein EUGRSUZ_J00129 [Eucalyptus grandis]
MGLRALPLPSSHNTVSYLPHVAGGVRVSKFVKYKFRVSAQSEKGKKEEGKEKKQSKQSLFGSVTDALDFSQVRSPEDADLLEDAREATRSVWGSQKEDRRDIQGLLQIVHRSGRAICGGGMGGQDLQDMQEGHQGGAKAGGQAWEIRACRLRGELQVVRQLLHQALLQMTEQNLGAASYLLLSSHMSYIAW